MEDKLKSLNSFTDGTRAPVHKETVEPDLCCVPHPHNTRPPLPTKTTRKVLAETHSKPSHHTACRKEAGKKEENKTVVNAKFHFKL